MNILVLTPSLPSTEKQTGADICLQAFLNALRANGCELTVLGFLRVGESLPTPNKEFISVGSCHVETKEAKLSPLSWMSKSLFKNLPYTAARYYSKRYISKVQKLLNRNEYDVIVLDHSYQIAWIEPFIAEKHKIVSIAHNIENQVYADRISESKNKITKWLYQRESALIKKIEHHLAVVSAETWALTDNDAEYFSAIPQANRVRVMSLPASLGSMPNTATNKTCDICLIGSWIWKPNGDGLHWFFQKVYPLLPPYLKIEVAGRGADWLDKKYSNVAYRGFVPDAKDFIAQARVIAIPSICGGGIQIKTLNSIGLGLPIVATPFAMRGISNPPSFVAVAKHPQDFADSLLAYISSGLETTTTASEAAAWAKERQENFFKNVSVAVNEICGK